jgi:hypothetical protein
MNTAVMKMFSLILVAHAGVAQSTSRQEHNEVPRLESVNWDLSHTLSWTVKRGTEVNGEFIPIAEEHYEITRMWRL